MIMIYHVSFEIRITVRCHPVRHPVRCVLVLCLDLQGGDHRLGRPDSLHGAFEGLLIFISGFADLHGRHGGNPALIKDVGSWLLSLPIRKENAKENTKKLRTSEIIESYDT